MRYNIKNKSIVAAAVAAGLSGFTGTALAQDNAEETETISVTGIRSALASAINEKRGAASIKEVIKAEDIGKLPDNNLAEVLENITGVQIDRSSGVGTSVQIRGASTNRVEINGVSTLGPGTGRGGISFEDLPAALISSLEVTKAPTAKTIEGSVGGTINLRTLRGNSLSKRLMQFRVQAENSHLADSTTPKISGTYGNNWETDFGKLGFVATGSYGELDVASAEPRFDRDRVVLSDSGRSSAEDFPFLRTQFLDQPFKGRKYETTNFTTSLELQTTDELKFYFDATINDQQSVEDTNRAYFSGTGGNHVIDATTNTGFETVNLGTLDGEFGDIHLGEVQVVTSGILGVGFNGTTDIDPNLRTDNRNSARLTTSRVFAFGSEYVGDGFVLKGEVSLSDSDTDNQGLNSSLDFINPNGQQPTADTKEDNGTPAIFKLSDGTFEFGIAPGLPETPTASELLDPSNYGLRSTGQSFSNRKGSDTAARLDLTYDVSDMNPLFIDLHAGIRWNERTLETSASGSNSRFSNFDRPRADLFADIVEAGKDNFTDADDRELSVDNYLVIRNDISFSNPDFVRATINDAIKANNELRGSEVNGLLENPTSSSTDENDISEQTTALYLQGDYELEVSGVYVSGNAGFRYINTDLTSTGNADNNGVITQSSQSSSYDYILPRINVNAELADNTYLRLGIGKDIKRPGFNDLSTSVRFGSSASGTVNVGNPKLQPEEIWSYDLSLEHYFSPSAYVSVGFFHKERSNLIAAIQDEPAEPIGDSGQIERDVTAPCEDGGVFNPNVPPENYNVFSSRTDTQGICVAQRTNRNVDGTETQTGLELAAQYDLSEFEDELGWASGFGVIANYTIQESGAALDEYRYGGQLNGLLNRTDTDGSTPTTADDVISERITLDKLSENAYNFTLFYDKHDLSVRMRYTWRDAFTETLNRMRFNLPPVVGARGQLNMSVNYEINDTISVGVEGVNLTQEDRTRWCFNEGALLCEQNLTDRRITFGITAKM